MTLIGILVALLIERALSHVREWREHAWFSRYVRWLGTQSWANWIWETPWGLLLLLAPLAGVALLQGLFHGGVLELLGLIFSILVLIFCLGPRDLGEEVHAYLRASEAGDEQEMADIARDLGAVPSASGSGGDCQRLVTAILIQGHERLLAVLFWFYLLGPFGAVLYRFAAGLPRLLETRDCSMDLLETARRLHAVLAWVPARAVAGLYMLAGSTDDALANWKASHDQPAEDWGDQTWQLLARVGCGAMQIEDGNNQPVQMEVSESLLEALGLLRRALLLALGVLAAFTLGGWLI